MMNHADLAIDYRARLVSRYLRASRGNCEVCVCVCVCVCDGRRLDNELSERFNKTGMYTHATCTRTV